MNTPETCLSDQYCVFRVSDAEFAISAAAVREVADRAPIVAIPQPAGALKGLCHHRNEFLPVLSLPAVLGEPEADDDIRFLLVIEGSDGPWALLITRAIALESLEMASLGRTQGDAPVSVVMGTASFRGGVVRVLDADRLYQSTADMLADAWVSREVPGVPQESFSPLKPQTTC